MKKFLLIAVGSLALLALVAGVGLYYFMGSIVKNGVNRFGPQITKAPLTLQGASISPFSGQGTLTELFVGNPTGWSSPKAFSVARIDVSVEPGSIFSDHVVINSIVIEQPEFVYETKLVASNIGDLLKNVEASLGPSDPNQPAKSAQKLEIRKFVMRDGKVTAGIGPAAIVVTMPPIELTGLGANGGITAQEAAVAVMRSISASVLASVSSRTLPAIGNGLGPGGDAVKKAGEAIRDIFGGKK